MLCILQIFSFIAVVRLLLASGCDVDQQSERRRTALHMAAWHERVKVVRLLLEANCDGNLRDRYGDTALMLASRKGHLEIMQVDHFEVMEASGMESSSLKNSSS